MGELSFFGSNGNPAPVTDDLVDTASPPELSQVESIDDDEYPPAQYDPPVDDVNPTSDSPTGNHMPDGTEDDSVSVGIGIGIGLWSTVFPVCRVSFGFWQVLAFSGWFVGRKDAGCPSLVC